MSDKTIRLAKTIQAFNYDSENLPQNLKAEYIGVETVANNKLVHDEITINGTAVSLGGSITIHGGGGQTDNGSLTFSTFTPSSATQSPDATQTVHYAVTAHNGDVQGSVRVTVTKSGSGGVVLDTEIDTETQYSVSLDRSDVATYSFRASATLREDAGDFVHTASATFHVNAQWYAGRRSTSPDSEGQLTSQGVWTGSADFTAPSGTDTLYIALPTRSAGYRMLDGDLRLFGPADGTTPFGLAGNHTLYSTNEAAAGVTYKIQEV